MRILILAIVLYILTLNGFLVFKLQEYHETISTFLKEKVEVEVKVYIKDWEKFLKNFKV